MEHSSEHSPTHESPGLRIYFLVYAALIILMVLTVAAARFELGVWSEVIALTIAVIKAVLVVLYFMHLRYSSRLIWMFAAAGVIWLFILFLYTFTDYLSRGWVGSF
jgi:cytochrome c oxidase subunit 4